MSDHSERAGDVSDTFPSDGMELTHILVVSDMSVSRDFYRDVLGATVSR